MRANLYKTEAATNLLKVARGQLEKERARIIALPHGDEKRAAWTALVDKEEALVAALTPLVGDF